MVDLVGALEVVLLALGIVGASLWIAFQLGRERLKTYLFDSIDEYIDDKMEEMNKNPAQLQKIGEMLMKSLNIERNPTARSGSLNIGGFKIPSEIVSGLLARFLPKAAETAVEANPFG